MKPRGCVQRLFSSSAPEQQDNRPLGCAPGDQTANELQRLVHTSPISVVIAIAIISVVVGVLRPTVNQHDVSGR